MNEIIVRQMPNFKKTYKKLHANVKEHVNKAIMAIINEPTLGQEKKGDLAGVYVYKFKSNHQELLLAYEWNSQERLLLGLGFHENFYRDLKKKI